MAIERTFSILKPDATRRNLTGAINAKFEAAGRDKMKALPGHEVYTLTPDQLKQWQAAVAPLQKAWGEAVKKAGGDPDAIYKDFQATVAKNGAGF